MRQATQAEVDNAFAYMAGELARRQGHSLAFNPFPRGSRGYHTWMSGYKMPPKPRNDLED